ncbi:MAG: hypothetical protein WC488_01160 [Candidatus Micrarchaeia archaeon]
MGSGETFGVLEKRWASACRILFKSELGSLREYAPWLRQNNDPIMPRKSSISGRSTSYAIPSYAPNSKWISLDEIDFKKRFKPLEIDELKDIDTLVPALAERFYYAGNVVLGNSGFVEDSSNISDSFYMHETGTLADSKYVAYSTLGRLNQDCFGCNGIGESQFCIKCYETFKDKRCFELWMGQNCSDCFYSHNLNGCQECLFCFNLKNARHAIGNLALGKEKYFSIKESLISQIAEGLKKSKRIPSLVEMVEKSGFEKPASFASAYEPVPGPTIDKSPIQSAFSDTLSLLLNAKVRLDLDDCSAWLQRYTRAQEKCRSAASGLPVFRRDYSCYFRLPRDRLLTASESQELGPPLRLSESDAESLRISNAPGKIGKIAFFTSEYFDGTNLNLVECPTSSDSANCYRSSPVVYAKYCAYCFWPRSTAYAFGCESVLDCDFCVNCYNSVKLSRCFELDSCRECSDVYFSHNCEASSNCMFCFNAKSLRYAVGNVEIGREKYMEFRKKILECIARELENSKDLKWSIFNLGSKN